VREEVRDFLVLPEALLQLLRLLLQTVGGRSQIGQGFWKIKLPYITVSGRRQIGQGFWEIKIILYSREWPPSYRPGILENKNYLIT
jgi:hypothetical protein